MKHIFTIAIILLMAGYCNAQDTIPDFVPGEIHVKAKTEYPNAICQYDSVFQTNFYSSIDGFDSVANVVGINKIEPTFKIIGPTSTRLKNIYSIFFESDSLTTELIAFLDSSDQIEYCHQVPVFKLTQTPSDPQYDTTSQWNLFKVMAESAWSLEQGRKDIKIAIVDDAVLINHEDLKNKIWVNQGELPAAILGNTTIMADGIADVPELLSYYGASDINDLFQSNLINGLDDDSNGHVDDILGWDASSGGSNNPNPPTGQASSSFFSHGTYVAGVAGAQTSTTGGNGIASIGWECSIIPIKCKSDTSTDTLSLHNVYQGIEYAISANADIINMSFGAYVFTPDLEDLMKEANDKGILLVAAAGNENSSAKFYPAAYDQVLAVGASTTNDEKASSSNYGGIDKWIDVMAPGYNILSTGAASTSSYEIKHGTSLASPLVSGLLGLMKSHCPGCTNNEIINSLKLSCDSMPNENLWDDDTLVSQVGHGRINAYNSLNNLAQAVPNAQFSTSFENICPGTTLQLIDESTGFITSWQWSSPDSIVTFASTTEKNPEISVSGNSGDSISISLIAFNDSTGVSDTIAKAFNLVIPDADIIHPTSLTEIDNNNSGYFLIEVENADPPYFISYSDNFGNSYTVEDAQQNPIYVNVSPMCDTTTTYYLDTLFCNGGTITLLTATVSFNSQPGGCFSQLINNNWTFGDSCRIQFKQTTLNLNPGTSTLPVFDAHEGCASISDKNGDLMFYTEATNIYDRTMNPMSNGANIMGNTTSTQASIILPKSLEDSTYYLISVGPEDHPTTITGFWYNIIDMKQPGANGGTIANPNGKVIVKDSIIETNNVVVCEKLTWVKHGSDPNKYWVITHEYDGNRFLIYLVTPYHISFHSSVNITNGASVTYNRGVLKANLNGDFLAAAYQAAKAIELYSFNNLNGSLELIESISTLNSPYGLEFSPDGGILYYTQTGSYNIHRFGVSGSGFTPMSPIHVTQNNYHSLQLTPDHERILLGSPQNSNVASFETPNLNNPGYNSSAYTLAINSQSQLGFPQLVPSYTMDLIIADFTNDCNNSCSGTATALAVSNCTPIEYDWDDPMNQSTAQAIGLCPDIYTVTATDACGCTNSVSVVIDASSVSISNIDVVGTCTGNSTGSINVSVVSSYTPLFYDWSNGDSTSMVNGLLPGTYSLTISDITGCEIDTTITVPNLDFLVNIVEQDPTCFNYSDGSINLTVGNGSPPYVFSWNTGATTEDLSNLSAGMYDVSVTDASGCIVVNTITLQNPLPMSISAITQSNPCYGYSVGYIDITAVGSYQPYQYVWSNGETTQDLFNLPAGYYSVTITDTVGCDIFDTTYIISEPVPLDYYMNHTRDSICDCEAYALVNTLLSYQFAWSTGETTQEIDSLCPDTYYVTIADPSTGCMAIDSAIILYDTSLLWANVVVEHPICPSLNNGSLSVTVGGTEPTYYVEWSPFSITDTVLCTFNGSYYEGTTPVYDSLAAGMYSITVTSDSGCIYIEEIYLEYDYEFEFSLSTNPYCNSTDHGDAIVSVITGTPPYTYNWSNAATVNQVHNLEIGTHNVMVTDANGCSDSQSFLIDFSFHFDVSVIDEDCDDACSGEIEANIINPVGSDYDYWLNDGSTIDWCLGCGASYTFDTLCPNNYFMRVYDSNGCESVDSLIIVSEADTFYLDHEITVNNCNVSNDYTISLDVTGTASPFSYSWSNGATIDSLNVTSPGTYGVTVTDTIGCTITTSIDVDSVLQVDWIPVPPTCHNFNDGSITAYATHGLSPYTYEWSTGATIDSIYNLDVGDYTLTVTDQFGCELSVPISLTDIYMMALQMDAVPPTCPDINGDSILGYIDLEVLNGQAPFSYSWSTSETIEDLDSLYSGVYIVTVTGDDGCVVTDTALLTSPGLHLTFDERGEGCDTLQNTLHNQNGMLTVEVTGGVSPYSYAWSDLVTTTDSIVDLEDFDYYSVTVTDANGCTGIDSTYTLSEQTISVPFGWSIWSTYIDDLGNVLQFFEGIGLATEISIMKNGAGLVYWPLFALNTIGDFTVTEGYQIKMASAQTFVAEGRLTCPEDEIMSLDAGWSIISYLRMSPMNAVDVFSNIVNSVTILKAGNGLIYWPMFGLNTIGNMEPGQGYQIKMLAADNLVYVPNYYEYGTKASNTVSTPDPGIVFPSDADIRTDKFMVIGIPLESWDIPPQYGDEVLVHGENGQLVGRSIFLGGFTAVVLYGDDMTTLFEEEGLSDGEGFTISSVAQGTKAVRELKVDSWKEGIGTFEHEMISVVGEKESPIATTTDENKLFLELYPNPGTGMFKLKVYSSFEGKGEIEIYNFSGQKVYGDGNVLLHKGWQEFSLNLEKQATGPYSLRLISDETIGYSKLIIIQ